MRHGRYPRLRWLRWALITILVVLVVAATGGQAIDAAAGWVRHEYERLPWYATRISALLAYLALGASTIYGLLLSTRILDRVTHRPISFTLHQDLAGIGVALALVHAAVLMIDRSVPYSPAEVVVPLIGPYRPLWVAWGQLALGLSLVVLLSFYVRKRIGTTAWRTIHYLSFLAFVGATVHGLMAGSDTGAAWVYLGYLALSAVVAFLTTYRIVLAVSERRQSRGAPAPVTRTSSPVAKGPAPVAKGLVPAAKASVPAAKASVPTVSPARPPAEPSVG